MIVWLKQLLNFLFRFIQSDNIFHFATWALIKISVTFYITQPILTEL